MAKTTVKKVQCGRCKNCTPTMDKEKLSIAGKPILGTCPYWTESKSVLLSWWHVCKFYDEDERLCI